MNPPALTAPIEKSVLLVGAGNAHLVFLKRWSMRPLPGVAVTLVNEASVIPYSAMVPGHIAGDYSWDDITIDLVRLCQSVHVRFVAERAVRIDPAGRQVHFEVRPPLRYDALSLGLGSLPACPANFAPTERSLAMRPLGSLLRKLDVLEQDLRQTPRAFHFVVVGGGASGCELAVAVHKRLGGLPGFRMTLLQGNLRLLPHVPAGAARAFLAVFHERGIACRLSARVIGSQDGCLLLQDGDRVAFDAVLWATSAAPPLLLSDSGLAVDSHGFLQINESLQSISDPAVFAAGDCATLVSHPDLPKNGVHAVRQGAVLYDNIAAFLKEQATRPYRPQRNCLYLLNTADAKAILNYGPLTWTSRRARRLKDRIDRAWMAKFTRFVSMSVPDNQEPESYQMRCGGCGSKISSDVLSSVLSRLDLPDDPRVVLGCRTGEDAAVHRVRPELFGPAPEKLLEVQTVDYFKAFLDDPYLFGRIAALNALSDLYAMNARPFSALAIAALPHARGPIQEAQLYELLAGALETFKLLGVVLTGGHTTEAGELALGFAVTGFGEEGRLFQKKYLHPGDVLILTKPLGTGALLAAAMRGQCPAPWFDAMIASMLLPNRRASEIFASIGVTACTDVTGFGLAGHLLEMLDQSQVSGRLNPGDIPLYEGFVKVVEQGIVSTLQRGNAKMAARVVGSTPVSPWLFDPQTSGGLLGAVSPDAVPLVLEQLHQAGYSEAKAIGTIAAKESLESLTIVLE